MADDALTAAVAEVLAAMQEFIDEGYEAVRGDGQMSAAYVVGACEALHDRFAQVVREHTAAEVHSLTFVYDALPPEDFKRFEDAVERILADRLAGERARRAADAAALARAPWGFGDEAACRYLASVSWPWEREENRDAWAVTMLHRPDLLAREIVAARERLESAIAALAGDEQGGEGR